MKENLDNIQVKVEIKCINLQNEELDLVSDVYIPATLQEYVRNVPSPRKILRSKYERHYRLYKELGVPEELWIKFHGNDSDFDCYCDGWKNFLFYAIKNDVGARLCNLVAELIAEHIKTQIERKRMLANINVSSTVKVEIAQTPSSRLFTLPDVELNDSVFLVTKNGVYKAVLHRLQDVKTLSDLNNMALKTMKRVYERQLEIKYATLQEEIERLKQRLAEERSKMFISGLKIFSELQNSGWIVEGNELILSKTIKVKRIRYENKLYTIPSCWNWYVTNVHVKIKPKIFNDDVWVDEHYHPNVHEDDNTVCLGDLEGKDLLTVVKNIVKILEIANLDSAYWEPEEFDPEILEGGGKVWKA